ncbi:hypothetical protein A4X09_0g942 [Tilletia walkeri]|uniref:Peptidase S9 prolyl oligopeptidase catalytic domain-containing protein n=1 Tax=Tilletia walkeri TaxID=117179 RepID=A0A8X7NEF3_9BASI|nr:hypothetical protein A4X09_0g942 [Tilletia walkeri]
MEIMLLLRLVLTTVFIRGALSEQHPFLSSVPVETQRGTTADVVLSTEWVAMGPYPAGMREQHLGANPAAIFGHPSDVLASFKTENATWLPPFTTYANRPPRASFVSKLISDSAQGNRQKHALSVSFPISFEEIRSYQGWTSLQWQSYLSSELVVECKNETRDPCPVFISVERAAEFAVVPRSASSDFEPTELEWFTCDWYSYNDGPETFDQTTEKAFKAGPPPQPHILLLATGQYSFILRTMYEDRIFGDPRDYNNAQRTDPIVNVVIDIGRFEAPMLQSLEPGDAVPQSPLSVFNLLAPSIVNGRFAGWGIAVDVLNHGPDVMIVNRADLVVPGLNDSSFSASIPVAVRIEPLQTRSIPVQVQQSVHNLDTLSQTLANLEGGLTLHAHDEQKRTTTVETALQFDVVDLAPSSRTGKRSGSFMFTYITGDGSIGISAATAPEKAIKTGQKDRSEAPAILALHGAGVNALDPAWANALPRQEHSWTILPTGATAWGFDWQLSSSIHARAAVRALCTGASIFYSGVPSSPHLWDSRIPTLPGTDRVYDPAKLIVVGHSNGGQGAWHFMTKHPNEVLGGVVAAGYIKMMDYVGPNWHVGRQHADPVLTGILRSSLSPFENDLSASNLAGIPLLVKYGERDTNVPTWHSRSMASLVTAWNQYSLIEPSQFRDLVQVVEVPGKEHWWDDVLLEKDVVQFIQQRSLPESEDLWRRRKRNFRQMQLSLTDPAETGSMGMFRVTRVLIPGRLARLTVSQSVPNFYTFNGVNVGTISLDTSDAKVLVAGENTEQDVRLRIDNTDFSLTDLLRRAIAGNHSSIVLDRDNGTWHALMDMEPDRWSRPMGPMIRALTSSGPLQIVLPSNCTEQVCARYRSVGRRFAHDIFLYGRLDSRFLLDTDVVSSSATVQTVQPGLLDSATVIVLGGPEDNLLAKHMDSSQPRPLRIERDIIRLQNGTPYFSPCLAFASLAPHPLASAKRSLALSIWGNDLCGIETAARLLPVRTGAQIPEWVVVDGKRSAWQGAGGILAAGWYSSNWTFSESMSFLS